jgi:hypothetical protein
MECSHPAIKLNFYKTKFKTYLFTLASNFGEILINDQIKISHTAYGTKEFELAVEPKKVVKFLERRSISHYEDTEKNKITPEQFESKKAELLKNADRELGDVYESFQNIDDEYAYKKFLREWNHPVFVHLLDLIPVGFSILNFMYSEYKEIVPLQTVGGELDNPTCICTCNPVQTLKDICKDLNIPVIEHEKEKPQSYQFVMELPSHSGIKYAKLNNTYICTKEGYEHGYQHRASYDECVVELKRYKQGILDIIKKHLKMEIDKEISKSERREICSQLTSILEKLQSVETTKKTSNTFYKVKEDINKLLKTLQGIQ